MHQQSATVSLEMFGKRGKRPLKQLRVHVRTVVLTRNASDFGSSSGQSGIQCFCKSGKNFSQIYLPDLSTHANLIFFVFGFWTDI